MKLPRAVLISKIAIYLTVPILAACATTSTRPIQKFPIEIISEPPGANIEINEEYQGKTPMTVYIRSRDGYFYGTWTFRALPTIANQCTQTKIFTGFGYYNDAIPRKIFFDMRLCPISPSIDVNMR